MTARTGSLPTRTEPVNGWSILGYSGDIEAWNARPVAGEPVEPRLAEVPVRLPLPPADHAWSIYENQKALGRRFSEAVAGK
jgi:phytanoyl-CoA hydroxylase